MKINVGISDRYIRVVAGLIMIAAGVFYGSYWGVVGAIPIITAAMGWCPAYLILGTSTCSIKSKKSSTATKR